MILNDLISSPMDCARKTVNNPHLHLNNGADGVENEVGYIAIEITSDSLDFDVSMVFDQVNFTF